MVMMGRKAILKSEQPIPDPNDLSIPATITLDVDRRFKTLVYICVAICMVGMIVTDFLVTDGQFWRPQYILATLSMFATFIYGAKRLTSKPYFTITEDAVESSVMGVTRSIGWDDIAVFCTHANKKNGEPESIELSNASTKVIILWPHPGMRRYYPAISYADYDRQMEALLSLIAAKTDLLLVDVRADDGEDQT